MKIVKDGYGIVRDIQEYKNKEILKRDDDKIRDGFFFLVKIDDRFFLECQGNVSPNRLGSWFVEVSKKAARELQAIEDVDSYHQVAGQYSV